MMNAIELIHLAVINGLSIVSPFLAVFSFLIYRVERSRGNAIAFGGFLTVAIAELAGLGVLLGTPEQTTRSVVQFQMAQGLAFFGFVAVSVGLFVQWSNKRAKDIPVE